VFVVKQWKLIPIVLVTLAAATACPGLSYPNPPGPTLTSLVVSQDTVTAGTPFTVTVSATDTHSPVAIAEVFLQPTTDQAYGASFCDNPAVTPGADVTVVFTCALPDFVPNGAWKVSAYVDDEIPDGPEGLSNGAGSTVLINVVGGSEDRQAPVRVSDVISPDPVVLGQPFSYTVQVSDDHLVFDPQLMTSANIVNVQVPNPPPRVVWSCGSVTPTQISPTVEQFAWTNCVIGPNAVATQYSAFMHVADEYGHDLGFWHYFDVVAPA
jgi:hypothetical protein